MDTEEKANNKSLNQEGHIKRNVEKSLDLNESSPMDPPDAYDQTMTANGVKYDQMDSLLQQYMDEHKVCIEKIDLFEKDLGRITT